MLRKTLIASLLALVASQPLNAEGNTTALHSDQENTSVQTGLPYTTPGRGIVDYQALNERIISVYQAQFGAFRDRASALVLSSEAYCASDIDKDALNLSLDEAWLAWAKIEAYQFGPMEQTGAALSVNFWPDKKNFVGRGLRPLLQLPAEQQKDVATIEQASGAAQGFPAIEMLLHEDTLAECPLIVGISAHIEQMAKALYGGWFDENGWADLVRQAGPDNPVYLSPEEFTRTAYTAIDFSMMRMIDMKLGRPLNSYDRPMPRRAEAWRSGLSFALIDAELASIAEVIDNGFAGDIREPDRKWVLDVIAQSRSRISAMTASLPDAVGDVAERFKVEALQNKLRFLKTEIDRDIGPNLGVNTGFSAGDGD